MKNMIALWGCAMLMSACTGAPVDDAVLNQNSLHRDSTTARCIYQTQAARSLLADVLTL